MANNTVLQEKLEEDINNNKKKTTEWKTIGVRIRNSELPIFNRQLDRLNYSTLGELAKDLIDGKITKVTEEQQIDIMNTNLQGNAQITSL
jgi:hypothetical protein